MSALVALAVPTVRYLGWWRFMQTAVVVMGKGRGSGTTVLAWRHRSIQGCRSSICTISTSCPIQCTRAALVAPTALYMRRWWIQWWWWAPGWIATSDARGHYYDLEGLGVAVALGLELAWLTTNEVVAVS